MKTAILSAALIASVLATSYAANAAPRHHAARQQTVASQPFDGAKFFADEANRSTQ